MEKEQHTAHCKTAEILGQERTKNPWSKLQKSLVRNQADQSLDQLVQEFNDFFINKIRDIRTDIMESSIYQPECDRENRSLQCESSGFEAPSEYCCQTRRNDFTF